MIGGPAAVPDFAALTAVLDRIHAVVVPMADGPAPVQDAAEQLEIAEKRAALAPGTVRLIPSRDGKSVNSGGHGPT